MNNDKISLKQHQSLIIYSISGLIIVLDQVSKYIVKKSMYLHESMEVLGDFFRLTYIENPGMAFGIQLESKFWFTLLSIAASIIVLVYLIRLPNERFLFRLSLSLIFGGAIGNLIDRILYGKVVDFFDVEFFNISIPAFKFFFISFPGYDLHRWPVFNVADAAVSCGMILIIWMILFQKVTVQEELAT